MNPPPQLALLPEHADVFGWAARTLLESYQDQLPDLSTLTLILPTPAASAQLRRSLLQHADRPLLGPTITTLSGFAQRGAVSLPLSALDCRLLLTELLAQHPGVLGDQDHWMLAADLFTLFEALSTDSPGLARDAAQFLARIERGYGGLSQTQVSREASAIHLLWQAYLQDTRERSPAVFHLASLRNAFATLDTQEQVVLIGFDQLSAGEQTVLQPLLATGQLCIWLQGAAEGRGKAALLDLAQTLGASTPINLPADDRARSLQLAFDDQTSPLSRHRKNILANTHIRLAAASHTEHETRIVDLAIREALLKGTCDIAVVTQNRRLARRLRALLERAGIPLRDEVGWALSTSAAAASLGHWLDCCEQNFPYRALLALLKSSFFHLGSTPELEAFEILIYQEQVASGLQGYKAMPGAPRALLLPLEQASRLMLSTLTPSRLGRDWSDGLLRSLKALPLWAQWEQDAAGMRLMRALEDLHTALSRQSLSCSWREFRRLLESQLEQLTFMPEVQDNAVRLLTLEQARGLRCELLILAGVGASQFPGRIPVHSLFNHGVRAELGLPHWTRYLDLQLSRFRSLLHAAPDILISYAPEEKQERALACPWVQWLETLGLAQHDTGLVQHAANPLSEITAVEELANAQIEMPKPMSVPSLLPHELSASAHQTLVDCPYRFFAQRCLGLYVSEEPDRPLGAKDFGERVHLILQSFHQQLPNLPVPFTAPVTVANRTQAEQRLHEIAAGVFAQDLRNRAMARVWAARFARMVEPIILWMLERQPDWPNVAVEQTLKKTLHPKVKIKGKLDRLETNARGEHGVVDYKTGAPPRDDDLLIGESVQAVHYALLADPCVRVEYLNLNPDKKAPKALEGETLDEVRMQVEHRLIQLYAQLEKGMPMPANGDQRSCDTCDHAGLCRKGGWHE